jgi:hypothetical protein
MGLVYADITLINLEDEIQAKRQMIGLDDIEK